MSFTEIKRILFGEPFPTSREVHERVDNVRGLAIFASDPISSNAYATEAILSILVVLGAQAFSLAMPVVLGIAFLVLMVAFSYIQTILHYPQGGGSYVVSKDNLGTLPSLAAAGALLTDYVLTVAVSVSAGVRAITSAFPGLYDYRVWLGVGFIIFLTWINLRGIRESGAIFAIPTYAFVGGVLLVIVIGLVRYFGVFGAAPLETSMPAMTSDPVMGFSFTWLLLRAFAAGCTALTGIEAISDGVQAFKPPESKNAAKTMISMAVIAMSLFIGISFLATHMHLAPSHADSILSQMTRQVTGGGILYYWVQLFTMLILVLAANTGFQDFPRVSSFLAHDGFMPRWISNRGDRLVFSAGIVTLAVISSIIVVIFQADELSMLPLYAIGVMVSFTLSQLGMARLMHRVGKLKEGETLKTKSTEVHYEKGWRWKMAVSAVGALVTFVVLLILIATKFANGAWIIVIAVPSLIAMFYSIRAHYNKVADTLSTEDLEIEHLADIADLAIIPMGDIHKGSLLALQYAQRISNNVQVVCIVTSESTKERFQERWDRFPSLTSKAKLVYIDYDYRDIITPIIDYILKVTEEDHPNEKTTVLIPEFISSSIRESLLHNHTANLLRGRLRSHQDIIIIDVPFHLDYEKRR